MEKVDVEARARKARELFMSGYNCSQSVFLAYADLYGIDPKLASTIVAPLGGGMGRLREVCGAVSAAFMLTGLKYPNPSPGDKAAKTRSYAVVQELAERFRRENVSIDCRNFWDWEKDPILPSRRIVLRLIISDVRVPIISRLRLVSWVKNSMKTIVWNDLPYQVL